MKKMKKFAALMLSAACVFSMAGCGSDGAAADSGGQYVCGVFRGNYFD